MLNSRTLSTFTAAAILILGSSLVAADSPRPGLYKITAKTDFAQLGAPQSHIGEQCITEEQFEKDPRLWTPEEQRQNQDCDVMEYAFEGGEVKMNMECATPGGKAVIVGVGTYTDERFEMTNTMTISGPGMEMKITTLVVGERTGDC